MKEEFIAAIHSKNKVSLTFFSKEDGRNLTRICAPMDYGPSRRTKDQTNRFHLWDYTSDKGTHVLSLLPNQIVALNVLEEHFTPSEFVTWPPNWFVKRDWGAYS